MAETKVVKRVWFIKGRLTNTLERHELEAKINAALASGWAFHGPPLAVGDEVVQCFTQQGVSDG